MSTNDPSFRGFAMKTVFQAAREITALVGKANVCTLPGSREILAEIGLQNMEAVQSRFGSHEHEPCISLEEIDVAVRNRTRPEQLSTIFALASEMAETHNVRISVSVLKKS